MSHISAIRLPAQPAIPALPAEAKPIPASSQPSPAAAVDLSPTASKLLLREGNNVPWGNSPEKG